MNPLHFLADRLDYPPFGIRTLDIQLTPMGGMSHLEHVPEQPSQELIISLAGPLVFLIWLWFSHLSLLCGAQFNAELVRAGRRVRVPRQHS